MRYVNSKQDSAREKGKRFLIGSTCSARARTAQSCTLNEKLDFGSYGHASSHVYGALIGAAIVAS